MLTLITIARPRFAAADGSMIDVDLTTLEFGTIPCTLDAEDRVTYRLDGEAVTNGDLFARARDGAFGPVADDARVMPSPHVP